MPNQLVRESKEMVITRGSYMSDHLVGDKPIMTTYAMSDRMTSDNREWYLERRCQSSNHHHFSLDLASWRKMDAHRYSGRIKSIPVGFMGSFLTK